MISLKKINFKEKFTEINFRQRMYKGKSFVTMIVTNEFFPSLVGENLVSGAIEVKLDMEDIHSLDELVGKSYQGDIGSVVISVNNDGIWEHQSYDQFSFSINKRCGRELSFVLETDDCKVEVTGVMVSLYTTSSSETDIKKHFDLSDFYDKPVIKEVANSQVRKYFVKE